MTLVNKQAPQCAAEQRGGPTTRPDNVTVHGNAANVKPVKPAIADFVLEKMSAYVAGGTAPETAAKFTRGELAAIYKGKHHSRDTSGAWRVTPPPEALGLDAAMAKCDEALMEILKICAERAGKGPPLNAETIQAGSHGKAPENAPRVSMKKSGIEGLKNYVKGETA